MQVNRQRNRALIIGAPLVMLLVGGAVGWFTRGTEAGSGGNSGTVVGRPFPAGSDLDATAPVRGTVPATNTMLVDRSTLIGYPEDTGVEVPKGAAVPFALDASGAVVPVDAASLQPVGATAPGVLPPVVPVPLAAAVPPAAPPSTAALTDSATTLAPAGGGAFVDPCTTAVTACAGGVARVLDAPSDGTPQLAPLTISVPFAATGAAATMCGTIEGTTAPDPFLAPAVRPTVAVVVNQPSSIALTGTWADGEPLEKLTMVTSSEFDQQWRTAWETEGVQHTLLACLTLPLDLVRTHAAAGRADLAASLLGISSKGRAESGGPVTVTMPLDGEDPPFVDGVTFGSLGEQRATDGSLVPTVHVHYAVAADDLVPPTSTLDGLTAKVYARHELVENADCAGWANNQQGIVRTRAGHFTVAQEQRTVSGRSRPVIVIDGDVELDPALPGGWSGYACVQLFVADASGTRITLDLRGTQVRSPLSPTYDIGVVIDDPVFPAGWTVEASWSTRAGALWCGPATLDPAAPGASCTTYARSMPDGAVLTLRAIDDTGTERPPFTVVVPMNTAYCTPDDPLAGSSNGCDTGFTERLKVPVDRTGEQSVSVSLQVRRTAAAGSVQTSPGHAWQIGTTRSFTF
jgi:hypothetical protein